MADLFAMNPDPTTAPHADDPDELGDEMPEGPARPDGGAGMDPLGGSGGGDLGAGPGGDKPPSQG